MWNFSTLINISLKTQDQKAPQGNILEFFLQDTIKATFWMENLTERWTQSRPFYPKSGLFFDFQKKTGENSSTYPLVSHLWVWLNWHQYPLTSLKYLWNAWINCSMPGPWICLILLHIRQTFEDVAGSEVARLHMQRFWYA